MQQISLNELRALRTRAQGLAPRLPKGGVVQAVRAVCGVNAQLYSAMALSLRARVEGLRFSDIETSRVKDRSVVRTWCLRGTMHLLAAQDLEWQLVTVAPSIIRAGWRWLEKRAGLGRARAEKVLDRAYRILKANGPMTRPDLVASLAQVEGEEIKAAAAGVVQLNGLLGRVCFGPDSGPDPTYAALDDWLGRPIELSASPDLPRLARGYLRGYGPSAPEDLASWSGLSLGDAKSAWAQIRQELVELNCAGRPLWLLSEEGLPAPEPTRLAPTLRLLPAFDTYLLGYKNRDFAVPPEYQKLIFHGGEITPTILVDGLAVGAWRYERRGDRLRIKAAPFSSFSQQEQDGIAAEADDIGRFYDLTPELSFVDEV